MNIWEWLMKQFGSGSSPTGPVIPADPAAEVRADVAADPTGMGTPGAHLPGPAGPNRNWQGLVDGGMKLASIGSPTPVPAGGGIAPAPIHQGSPVGLLDLVFGSSPNRKNNFGGLQ
jgi:hypothetical protein